MKTLRACYPGLLLLTFVVCLLFKPVHSYAQESTQVTIIGIPGILNSPVFSDLENDYRSGRFQVQFNYMSGFDQPREFEFIFQLRLNGEQVVSEVSDPIEFMPGIYFLDPFFDDVVFPNSFDDVIGNLSSELQNQLIQTGALPEGNYNIRIEARPVQQQPLVNVMPGMSNFIVRYPQPPILINPPNNTPVALEIPIFSWTPVVVPGGVVVEYEFLLVELFEGQNAGDGLLSNRVHAESVLFQQTTFPYTGEQLPLEKGNRYAWQVTAVDGNNQYPFSNEGESQIYEFVYGMGEQDMITPEELDFISLVPEFAELVDLDELEITQQGNELVFNGNAHVSLRFAEQDEQKVRAVVQDLRIMDTNLQNPVITGGSVQLDAATTRSMMDQNVPDFIEFRNLLWSYGSGLQAELTLDLPFGETGAQATGDVILSSMGLTGTAEVTGSPLAKYAHDYLDMYLDKVSVELPSGQLSATGDIRFMGRQSSCELTNFMTTDQQLTASFSCPESFDIPLVGDSELLSMGVNRVNGSVGIGLETGALSYDLNLRSTLGFLTTQGNYCGTGVNIALHSRDGIGIEQTSGVCPEYNPKVDLGFAKLRFSNLSLDEFSYDADEKQWDFEITLDSRLEIPAFEGWTSAEINGIGVSREGIAFEAIRFEDMGTALPKFDIEALRLELNSFGLEDFTFPLFKWDDQAPGPWSVNFNGDATIKSVAGIPYCLVGSKLQLSDGKIEADRVRADLDLAGFEPCEWEISPLLTVQLDAISGAAGALYLPAGGFQPFGEIGIGGGMSFNGPFMCEEQQNISFSGDDLVIGSGITGQMNNVVPACPVNIGPFEAQISSSTLSFSKEPGHSQQAVMEATAAISLSDGRTSQGSFSLNLMTGEFTDLDFQIEGPFDWHIPSEDNPVMSFRLSSASINTDGFMVDGRQTFLLGGENRGVTFDNLLLDLNTWRVNSGRILFDETFAFEAGISESMASLAFNSILPEQALELDPGLKMELGGTVIIDSLGVSTSGMAIASVAVGDNRYDDALTVEYSEDFAIGLYPFAIRSGRAEFYYEGDRVAYADEGGFHPDWMFFADHLVPERLPMPREDIAYIQLRDGDEMLVDVVQNSDGHLVISTLAGKDVSVVVPYLDPANPPTLADVSFNNFTITANPVSPEIIDGLIIADIPAGSPLRDLSNKNIPLSLRSVEFGNKQVENDMVTALYLSGKLNLFDRLIEGESDVDFYIQGDGFIRSNLSLSGVDGTLSLLEDRAKIGVDGIEGMFAMALNSGMPDYNFTVSGSLEVLTDEGYRAGADLAITSSSGGYFGVTYFDGYAFDESPRIGVGDLGLELDSIIDLPEFSYSTTEGFEFAIALDLGLRIPLSNDEELYFPLQGVEIRNTGIHLPTQEINDSVIPGLSLPTVDLAGFTFQPLAFRMPGFTFSWQDGAEFDGSFLMDFQVDLPEFAGTGLNPPEGLLFTDVGFDEGFLVGTLDPFNPLDGVEIPVVPGDDPLTLVVEQISGGLAKVPGNSWEQAVDFQINGKLGSLPAFEYDGECEEQATFTLAIIESKAFEGSIENVQPCGAIALGPLSMQVPSASLHLYLEEDEQLAILDASVAVTLPAREGNTPSVVTGALELDVFSGNIVDGSISINEPFDLGMPWTSDNPLFSFAMTEAMLDREGLTLSGAGQLETDNVQSSATFDALLIDLEEFAVKGGSATIQAGFDAQVSLSPFGLGLIPDDEPLPDYNALRFTTETSLRIDENGLGFQGGSEALILFNGDSYENLRVEMEDNFAVSLTGFAVTQGRAAFYWDEDGVPAEEPLAILDSSGFSLGGGLISILPDRIPLPSEDIAYLEIKDEEGQPLVSITPQDGGYVLSTDDAYLPLVIPSLEGADGTSFEAQVSFTLVTDDLYNVVGGTLSLESESSLESRVNLPVRLTGLELDNSDGLSLMVALGFDLPAVFEGHQANVMARLSADGIESATAGVGNYSTTYSAGQDPIYEFTSSDNIGDSDEIDTFAAALMGIEADFGDAKAVRFSGTLQSSLIHEEGDVPVFFAASWQQSGWEFNVDTGSVDQDLRFGPSRISLDGENPLTIHSEQDLFYISLNGVIAFDDLLEEPFAITVQELELGVGNWSSSPTLHLGLGSATGDLGNQYISLFNEALVIEMIDPSVSLTGRNLVVASNGNLSFMEREIAFEGLEFSTDGGFSLSEASASNIELIGDNVVLESLALSFDEGIRLTSHIAVNMPSPLDEYAEDSSIVLEIYRGADNQVVVDGAGMIIEPTQQYSTFELANFGEIELKQLRVDLNPFEMDQSGLYANAIIHVADPTDGGQLKPVIYFGEAGNIMQRPGIGITRADAGQGIDVVYDITGNVEFTLDMSFFRLTLQADATSSSSTDFEVLIGGQANINLEGITADLGYEGIRVTKDGVQDVGNLDGTGGVDIVEIFSLTIGGFNRRTDNNGFQITIAETGEKSPDELGGDLDNSDSVPIKTIDNVVELICFGPCPAIAGGSDLPAITLTIGGDSGNDSGFTGGVDSIFFYQTANGDRSLSIDGFNIAIEEIFTASASFNYEQQGSNMLIRAAAAGSINAGGTSVGAMVAGKFSNIDNQMSYGLFVAASVDPGIPIIPGVVSLAGAGGGFFYRPDEADFDMVDAALSSFGHELVNSEASRPQDGADFAIMLYAAVGIGGAPGTEIMMGQTFLQITNQSFYLDARVVIMQMDGSSNSIAGMLAEGAIFASAAWDSGGITSLALGIEVNAEIPLVLEGYGKIDFFYVKQESESVWGIIGETEFIVYGGILTGTGDFLVGPPGFMVDVGLALNISIPIVSLDSSVAAAIWIITADGYSMPFGAYVTFSGEACVGPFCVSAEAVGAFVVRNPEGYLLFASVTGCAGRNGNRCMSAWASISCSGVQAGRGDGEHSNIIAQAQAQKQQFEEEITNLIAELDNTLDQIPEVDLDEVFPDSELYAAAATQFYSLSENRRQNWVNNVLVPANNFAGQSNFSLYPALQYVLTDIMGAPGPVIHSSRRPANALNQLNASQDAFYQAVQFFKQDIQTDLGQAIELFEDSQQYFDQMADSFFSSPVSGIVKPVATTSQTQSVDFNVDDSKAAEQQQSAESLRDEMEQLDLAFRESINSVEDNINAMEGMFEGFVFRFVLNAHTNLIQRFDQYYAAHSNYRWKRYTWANNLKSDLTSNQTGITNAIAALGTTFQSRMNGTNQFAIQYINPAAHRKAQRAHFAYLLGNGNTSVSMPSPSSSSFSEVSDMYNLLSYPVGGNSNAVMSQINSMNTNYFYTMHEKALSDYSFAQVQNLVNTLFYEMGDHREIVFAQQKNLTQILDRFYTIKSSMTSILWNMNDNYISWREDIGVESDLFNEAPALSQFIASRQHLGQSLLPPTIEAITVNPNRVEGTFSNSTGISWSASHPVDIVENSIQYRTRLVSGSTNIESGIEDYLTIGTMNNVTVTAFKILPSIRTSHINFGVRVRGAAGNTAIRRASFPVDVGPGGNTTPPGGNVLPENTSPPGAPVIVLSDSFGYSNENGQTRYWTNTVDQLPLVINGYDAEVGISTYEYAVGTSPGGTDVLDWRQLQGERELIANIPAQQMRGVTAFFDMEEGESYYFSARVENTMGQMSPVAQADGPLVLDSAEPSAPTVEHIVPNMHQSPMMWPIRQETVTSVPPLENVPMDMINYWLNRYGNPSLYFEDIESTPEQSGISHYEYALSRAEEQPLNRFATADVGSHSGGTLEITGASNDPVFDRFNREVYLHIRAVDYAGNASDISTSGPYVSFDHTRPDPGVMKGKLDPSDIKLYITRVPYDPESDLLGIQYKIEYDLDGSEEMLRPFPSGNEVDMEWNLSKSIQQLGSAYPGQRYLSIPRQGLPVGENLYITYRTVNKKGMYSELHDIGPINLDQTRPVVPDVSLSFNTDTRKITVNLDGVHDPESGIIKVEYSVRRPSYFLPSNVIIGNTTIHMGQYGPTHGAFNLSAHTSGSISESQEPTDLRVYIRMTNGAGLVRTIHRTIKEADIFTPIPAFIITPLPAIAF